MPSNQDEPAPVEDTNVQLNVTDISFMNENLWLGWRRWTWVRVAFAAVVFMSAYGLWQVDENSDKDNSRAAQQSVDNDYDDCLRSNEIRDVVREVVNLASRNGATDLTRVPGFDQLDSVTQQFLINLRDMTAPTPGDEKDPDSFRNRAFTVLVNRDCDKEFPTQGDRSK